MTTHITNSEVQSLTRKGTCIEFFSAYQDHEYEIMVSLCTADADVNFRPLGNDGVGKVAELGKNLWALLMDCFPDIDNTIDTFEEDGEAIICKVCIFGTQAKDFAGIPSKGLRFSSDHIFIFKFDNDDRITSVEISWNHDSFCSQLGVNQ